MRKGRVKLRQGLMKAGVKRRKIDNSEQTCVEIEVVIILYAQMPNSNDENLDELLNSALDDFDKIEISRSSKNKSDSITASSSRNDANEQRIETNSDESARAIANGLAQGLIKSPESQPKPSNSQSSSFESNSTRSPSLGLGLGMPSLIPESKRQIKKKFGKETSLASETSFSPNSDHGGPCVRNEDQLTSTIEMLAQQTRHTVENLEKKKTPNENENEDEFDEEMVEKFVKQFEDMGSSQNVQSLMDNVMRQLLSKEVLYSPMAEIGEKYPQWLEENKMKLSEEENARYRQQYACIQELCATYESSPDDFQKIVDLMQRMQDCGQPPPEIVRQLAPGVELGEDGIPILPDLLGGGGSSGNPPNCSMM